MSHDMVQIDVSTLTRSQHDMLWMRLRADDVPFSFDGQYVAVPQARTDDAFAAMDWITHESAPMPEHYEMPHPFRRTTPDGSIVASRWSRLIGWFLDSVIVAVLYAFAARFEAPAWSAFAASSIYVVGMTHLLGQTLGKLVVGIRVADAETGSRPSWPKAALRWLVIISPGLAVELLGSVPIASLILAAAWIVIYLPILWDEHGQGLHDRIARTYVLARRVMRAGDNAANRDPAQV